MTPLKPEEIQAALDGQKLADRTHDVYERRDAIEIWFDAQFDTICRALAFTLAANGEPSDGMYELSTDIATYDLRPIAMYKCFIDKIWEELRGME